MNKGISYLLLFVVLSAMGLVMYSHITNKEDAPRPQAATEQEKRTTAYNGRATPLTAPQDGTGGLRPIEPPLNSARPAGRDTAPPITLSSDGTAVDTAAVEAEARRAAEAKAAKELEAKEKAKEEEEKALLAKAELEKAKAEQEKAKAEKEKAEKEKAAKKGSGAPGLEPLANLGGAGKPNAPAAQEAQPAASTPPPSRPGTHTLQNIAMKQAGSGVQLAISADSPFQCKTFMLDSPPRLVIDLPGSWRGMKPPAAPNSKLIKKVRLGQQSAGPRLVLDLNGPVKHRVERSGNSVNIIVQ